jgi:phosphonoacetate hydrolase
MSLPIQRTVVCMYDGFGMDYFEISPMPEMKRMAREGLAKRGRAIFPTLTNANNVSICCASWPAEHGVTTNCYFDEAAGKARFLEDPDFILAPTIFQRFHQQGVRSALLTCKAKTLKLLSGYADFSVAAEEPGPEVLERYGPPPPMYSSEVNYWLWEIVLDLLKSRPDLGLIYVHTTDYPMHMWAPEEALSLEHLAKLDELLASARDVAPDAMFLITADHGMNPKSRCVDLRRTCAAAGFELRFAVSPVADRLLKHHRGFGGVSYVYVNSERDLSKIQAFLCDLPGVDDALARQEAARRFHLMPERIGDLVILGDRDTVFGDLEGPDEQLAAGYRNHGSIYEEDIPLILYGYDGPLPSAADLQMNFDLTRWLCRTVLRGT